MFCVNTCSKLLEKNGKARGSMRKVSSKKNQKNLLAYSKRVLNLENNTENGVRRNFDVSFKIRDNTHKLSFFLKKAKKIKIVG